MTLFQAPDLKAGFKRLSLTEIDLIICDMKLTDGKGVEASKFINAQYP